ncbi:MAG: hypothetical protein HY518_02790 [Candidatus Aenigmarchaeota archaeon]|nr:hypothetical protein [Candidatus Aenigmarchaeota archaeon]
MNKLRRLLAYPVMALALMVGAEAARADEPVARLYSTHSWTEGGNVASGTLGVLKYGKLKFGYEKLDDGREFYGVKAPFWNDNADISLLQADAADGGNVEREYEVIGKVKPLADHELEIAARGFNLLERNGYGIAASYREKKDFSSPDNRAAGISFAKEGDVEKVGGYAWNRFGGLGGLFVGAATYARDNRFVVAMPGNGDRPAWACLHIDASSGFQLNQVLFSTDGVNITAVDTHEMLKANEADPTDSFTTGGGVFRYIVPPISARGRGFTAGVVHTRINEEDSIRAETVGYRGMFFIGGSYEGKGYSNARIGVPLGFQLAGGDGKTRNFLRAMPYYDNASNNFGVQIIIEARIPYDSE